ncbi:hypothetical protein V3C99_014712 [Haemonchus contortus]
MMYDDIANHKLNPYKGKLFNRPNGPDVYSGLKIDYKGDAVSAGNFLAVLKGDRDAVQGGNGRVIESNENDRIFVYYTDLGATGLMAFPTGMLMARQLIEALEEMHKNRKYNQLVFYLAACESGSMFKDLLGKKLNVYAVTSADEDDLEFATYCEDELLELPCLGDEFSVNWMEDSDKQDISIETLDEQFEVAKGLTYQSEVSHYGNLSIADEPVGWFHGFRKDTSNTGKNITQSTYQRSSWSSRDVELLYLQKLKQLGLRPDTIDDEIFIAEENHRPIGEFFSVLVHRIVRGQDLRREPVLQIMAVMKRSYEPSIRLAVISTSTTMR